jgi:hypothetical protein
MADALLIETGGDTAGIVIAEGDGFRFFASASAYYPVDGKFFASVGQVHAAVRNLRLGRVAAVFETEGLQPAA